MSGTSILTRTGRCASFFLLEGAYTETTHQSSVRHNLSSNRAFKKIERGPDEKGKGALWSIDPAYEHTFEEQDARKQAEARGFIKKGKNAIPLDPPLKRSVKEFKNAPLPPPLTSAPLIPKGALAHGTNAGVPTPTLVTVKHEPITASVPVSHATSSATTAAPSPASPVKASTPAHEQSTPVASTSTPTAQAPSSVPAIPASVRLPIVIGPVPESSPEASNPEPKPIVLHQNTLILNPTIFSHLTQPQLRDLEALGAQKALEILQGYIVRYYKEKLRAEGGRGRGRGRGRRARGAGAAGSSRPPAGDGLFTTTPLPMRTAKPQEQGTAAVSIAAPAPVSATVQATAPPVDGEPPMASLQPPDRSESPIIVVDDDDSDDPRVAKRPRLDGESL